MEKTYLEKMINDGLTIRQMSDKNDKSCGSIRYWLKKFDLKTRASQSSVKRCITCKTTENLYSNNYCKECDKKRISELGKKNKKKAVEYKGGCCEKCGYNKCIAALEFHHVDSGTKDTNFRTMKYWGWARIKKEIDKCVLVCSNCHREIHNFGTTV